MDVGLIRALIRGMPDNATVTVLNTWDGEGYPAEDISKSLDGLVIEVSIR